MYRDEQTGREVHPDRAKTLVWLFTFGALVSGAFMGRDWVKSELPRQLSDFDPRLLVKSLSS